MKLKNIIKSVILLTTSLLLSSCLNEWLTVNPKTEMTRDNLFKSEEGFKDALTGVYIQLKSKDGYGERLTMTTLEYLVSSWDVATNTTEQRLTQFLYTDQGVERVMALIFSHQYKVISSINSILGEIDEKRDLFKTEGLYELIKGECLGLRAFLHFDILRLFGPVPELANSDLVLPYVKTLSREPIMHISYNDYLAEILKDIKEASSLLEVCDPIKDYSLIELRNPGPNNSFNPSDTYFAVRHLRMNYYAVKSLWARVSLWRGDLNEAYTHSQSVIEAQDPNGSLKFKLGTSADMTNSNYSLPFEHIFALHEFSLLNRYNELFAAGVLKKGSSDATVRTQLYGNTGTDIREVYLWELITQQNQSKTYIIKKYIVPEGVPQFSNDFRHIPIMRVSEMYLIAIESAPTTAEAQIYWDKYRLSRNVPVIPLPNDRVALLDEIIKEYRREFFAEGQAFYNYKRVNAPKNKILWAPTSANVILNYVVPLPKTELINTSK